MSAAAFIDAAAGFAVVLAALCAALVLALALRRHAPRFLCAVERERQLREQLERVMLSDGALSLADVRGVRSELGIQAMEALSRGLDAKGLSALREAANEAGFRVYLRRVLSGDDRELILLALKLIGSLTLPAFSDGIVEVLRRFRDDAEVRRLGLLALSLLGCGAELSLVCADARLTSDISFRTLQGIFASYGGSKRELFSRLLDTANDKYVRRACIKRAGLDGIEELAPRIAEYLDDGDRNLRIDAVRALGQLKYESAGETLALMAESSSWEIRSAVVTALSEIDRDAYREQIINGIFDSEWWVRRHAAEALADSPDLEALLERVRASGDRFAAETLAYFAARAALGGGGEA